MRLAILLALLGGIPTLSAGVIPKGSSVFILDTPPDLRWGLFVNLGRPEAPLRIVYRSKDADYFLRAYYGQRSIATPDGRFVPVSVTLELVDAQDDQVIWSDSASREPGWLVEGRRYPLAGMVVRRLQQAMAE